MPEANYKIGETFNVQFAWKLPNGDYVRAIFQAEALDLVPEADKYLVRLHELAAGRQEDGNGRLLPQDEFSKDYWGLVGRLAGRRIAIAYEADDTHAIYMRLATLTGEHDFFFRYPD
ncbi:MAG: hypothetical protein GY803_32560 [Chloroflexi bacterium]|nr:hypothetical protein [Chloroflexota bacterium]